MKSCWSLSRSKQNSSPRQPTKRDPSRIGRFQVARDWEGTRTLSRVPPCTSPSPGRRATGTGIPRRAVCRTGHVFSISPAQSETVLSAPGARLTSVPVLQRKPIVLVVDDETLLRGVVRRALEPEMSVIEAPDGEDALALLDRGVTVDLVLTDFMMPRISGLQVMAVLTRYRPELPIIGMTGHADPALREGAAKFGVRVLQKPFEMGALVASVREILAERRDERSANGRKHSGAPETTA